MKEKIKYFWKNKDTILGDIVSKWMWSRKPTETENQILSYFYGESVEFDENEFADYLKYDSENPNRFDVKYDENLNRIW